MSYILYFVKGDKEAQITSDGLPDVGEYVEVKGWLNSCACNPTTADVSGIVVRRRWYLSRGNNGKPVVTITLEDATEDPR